MLRPIIFVMLSMVFIGLPSVSHVVAAQTTSTSSSPPQIARTELNARCLFGNCILLETVKEVWHERKYFLNQLSSLPPVPDMVSSALSAAKQPPHDIDGEPHVIHSMDFQYDGKYYRLLCKSYDAQQGKKQFLVLSGDLGKDTYIGEISVNDLSTYKPGLSPESDQAYLQEEARFLETLGRLSTQAKAFGKRW